MLYWSRKRFRRNFQGDVWRILQNRWTEGGITDLLRVLYRNNKNEVRVNNEDSKEFDTKIGVRQVVSLYCLPFFRQGVTNPKTKLNKLSLGFWKMGETKSDELAFLDYMEIMAHSKETLQFNWITILEEELVNFNMLINVVKTKTMLM